MNRSAIKGDVFPTSKKKKHHFQGFGRDGFGRDEISPDFWPTDSAEAKVFPVVESTGKYGVNGIYS